MTEIEVIARAWGNSLGVTIPKKIIEEEQIKENEEIIVEIKKKVKKPDPKVFGIAKDWKINAQNIKDRLREEWE
ncbi:AbrB/MazE/SpoVT family DNA-binding domain-containing protein [Candidatus Woesearchaeota archaeon]|nr:AbrB/MazE/SpoVT family DNA-binding domain-containing protein [Candidatus Woesearchaeota archaeon]